MRVGRSEQLKKLNRRAVLVAFDWFSAVVVALCVLVFVTTFFIRVVGVKGDSMMPTLVNGDRLILSVAVKDYKYGDIIVVDRYTDEPLIKRVIAVEGDRVTITSSYNLYVNGELMNEPYMMGVNLQKDMEGTITVPEGCVFVLGDNRTISKDSRMNEIGMISTKSIVGKVLLRIWPSSSIGGVYENLS